MQKISAGIFESMFNGVGGEVLYRPFNKNYAIGVEAWQVYQREYDQMFELRDYKTITGHTTFYYQEPRTNILIKIMGGRYLAKDSGFTFDFQENLDQELEWVLFSQEQILVQLSLVKVALIRGSISTFQ